MFLWGEGGPGDREENRAFLFSCFAPLKNKKGFHELLFLHLTLLSSSQKQGEGSVDKIVSVPAFTSFVVSLSLGAVVKWR